MAYEDLVVYQIAQILQNEGVGTFATDIFVSQEPGNPDNCITLYNTGGLPDGCLSRTERSGEIHTFQVRVRNNDYLTAHAKMEAVRAELEKQQKTLADSGGTNTFRIWQTTLPLDLPRDTTNRAIVVATFACLRAYA